MLAALITVVLLVSLVAPSAAQTSATLQGYVYDVSGAVVPGATVSVRSEQSGFDRSVNANAEGRYILSGIPAGSYRVITEATGFRSETIEEHRRQPLVRQNHEDPSGNWRGRIVAPDPACGEDRILK